MSVQVVEQPTPLVPPMVFFGGKRRIAAEVWRRLGDTPNYVEGFAGSLAVLLARPTAPRLETANDACGFIANFWRATQADPDAVAHHADWPVSELDLHARHLWLVNTGRERVARLRVDPEYFDPQVAGWYLWGINQWIGSGWCSGKGPRRLPEGEGVPGQIPYLAGHAQGANGAGICRKLPYLAGTGQGVEHKRPQLEKGGHGTHAAGVKSQIPLLSALGRGIHSGERGTCEERSAALREVMRALRDRLRNVRLTCGDWTRVVGPSVTTKNGLTAVFLDPPYDRGERDPDLYATESDCAGAVREWALANGDDPLLRLAVCGYETEEYSFPPSWTAWRWKTAGGYGSQGHGRGRENAGRECVWYSPHCLRPEGPAQVAFSWDDEEEAA